MHKIIEEFPDNEKYGLVKQIRRTDVSVSSNLAEWTSRKSGKEQAIYTNCLFIINRNTESVDIKYGFRITETF